MTVLRSVNVNAVQSGYLWCMAPLLLLLLAACPSLEPAEDPVVSDAFDVRASVEQLHIWNAPIEAGVEVLDAADNVVFEGETDYQGSLMVRELEPADGYEVRLTDEPEERTTHLDVVSVEESLPDPSFYDQTLNEGRGYLRTRDGTTLSYFLKLPGPPEDGPYPTLVNYSGYSPSRGGQPLGGQAEAFCGIFPILCDAPSFGSGILGGVMGYAVIGVNVRGTGCSGGAYDYFEPLQLLDGYDVVEIVAGQPWVKHNHVGLVGLSYPGITQLFVASTRPPSLAAISPMSVLADTGSSTLQPGGIYNDGFAHEWIENVLNKALPYSHGWIQDVVDAGDDVCEENQLLHSQLFDAIEKARQNPFYTDEVAAPLDPSAFVQDIDVPVYLSGQWQDEQTGPHFAALLDKFDSSPATRFVVTNGVHPDGFAPQALAEWSAFLDLFVAEEVPRIPQAVRLMVPQFMGDLFGDNLALPAGRFEDFDTHAEALEAWQAEDPVRVLLESGAADGVVAGAPEAAFVATFPTWPPESTATRWYLEGDGMVEEAPSAEGSASFEHDPEAGQRGNLASGSVNGVQPDWDWVAPTDEGSLSFLSEPLEDDLVLAGHGSVDLWVRSTEDDADLQVTLSDVRPDGMESFIQAGWLRASHRGLREDATELRPVKTHTEDSFAPLVPGEWTLTRVEIMPFGHVLHAGSRIRLTVDTPGGTMARWRFALTEFDTPPTYTVGFGGEVASSIVLPAVDVAVPSDQPECFALRGQPCRPFEAPASN
jgi:uncharacterized protein